VGKNPTVSEAGLHTIPESRGRRKMKYQAHRGVSTDFPENTMAAFIGAVRQGYDYIELDPSFTKDLEIVIMHDRTVNRTCRRRDGRRIKKDTEVSGLTLTEIRELDAGNGEKVPLLTEALTLASGHNVTVKLDNKIQAFPDAALSRLFEEVSPFERNVAFTCKTTDFAESVHTLFPDAEIHYDGEITEKNLSFLRTLTDGRFTVWLPFDNKITSWCKLKKATKEYVAFVKQYAEKCGLWILSEKAELEAAINFGADIIETPGQLKP